MSSLNDLKVHHRPIPPVTANNCLDALKEVVEIGTGQRGNVLDRFVTFRDLADADMIKEGIISAFNIKSGVVDWEDLADASGTRPDDNAEANWKLPDDENLLAYWSLDDGSSNETVDNSGNGYNGTLGNSPTWSTGISGRALSFDSASEQYVDIGTSSAFDFTSEDFNVSFWIKTPASFTQGARIVSRGAWEQDGWEFLFYSSGRIYVRTYQSGAHQESYSSALNTSTWYFVSINRSGEDVTIYVNAVDQTDSSGTHVDPATSSRNLVFGARSAIDQSFLDGILDEIRIYTRVLTEEEIKATERAPAGNGGAAGSWAGIGGDNKPDDNATQNRIARQGTDPGVENYSEGDFWYDTDDFLLYEHDGEDWVEIGNAYSGLSQMSGDLDDVSDGSAYIRTPLPWKKPGTVKIDGGELYANSVNLDDVSDGSAYIRAPLAWKKTGTVKIDGGELYADSVVAASIAAGQISAEHIAGGAFGNLTISSGTITIEAFSGLNINTGGSINIATGAGIVLNGDTYNPGAIHFIGSSGSGHLATNGAASWLFLNISHNYDCTLSLQGDAGYVSIGVDGNAVSVSSNVFFSGAGHDLGTSGNPWGTLYATAINSSGVVSCTGIDLGASGAVQASSYVALGVSGVSLYFSGSQFRPTNDQTMALGGSSYAFGQAYAVEWNDMADYFLLDDRDDLSFLHRIKGSGEIDPRTGLEIVNDSTLPPFILARSVEEEDFGDIVLNPDGKPYISHRANASWMWGMIKQLDNKIIALEEELRRVRGAG